MCVHACMCVWQYVYVCVWQCVCVCVCVWERERERHTHTHTHTHTEAEMQGWVTGCTYVDVWEAVIWLMGVGVKVDRMRIVIILVPSIYYIYSLIIVLMCVLLFILQHIFVTSIVLSNVYDHNIACLLLRSLKFGIIYTCSFSFFFCL